MRNRVKGAGANRDRQFPAYRFSFGTLWIRRFHTEQKQRYSASQLLDGTLARLGRNEGVRRMETAERKAVIGSPDLESLTTSHVERAFLTVRQELKRFERKGSATARRGNAQAGGRAVSWRLQLRPAASHARNHASGGRWPRRKAVEFRTGHGDDSVVLAKKMSKIKVIAKGGLDVVGDCQIPYEVRLITPSKGGNGQSLDLDAVQSDPRLFVAVKAPPGVSQDQYPLAQLLKSGSKGDYRLTSHGLEVARFRKLYHRLSEATRTRLADCRVAQLSSRFLPKWVLALARRYLSRFTPALPANPNRRQHQS